MRLEELHRRRPFVHAAKPVPPPRQSAPATAPRSGASGGIPDTASSAPPSSVFLPGVCPPRKSRKAFSVITATGISRQSVSCPSGVRRKPQSGPKPEPAEILSPVKPRRRDKTTGKLPLIFPGKSLPSVSVLFSRERKSPLRLHRQSGVAPAAFFHRKGFAQLLLFASRPGSVHHKLSRGKKHTPSGASIPADTRNSLPVLSVSRAAGKALVKAPVLPVGSGQKLHELRRIKQLSSASFQSSLASCTKENSPEVSCRTPFSLPHIFYMEEKLILPAFGEDQKTSGALRPLPSSRGSQSGKRCFPGFREKEGVRHSIRSSRQTTEPDTGPAVLRRHLKTAFPDLLPFQLKLQPPAGKVNGPLFSSQPSLAMRSDISSILSPSIPLFSKNMSGYSITSEAAVPQYMPAGGGFRKRLTNSLIWIIVL